MLEALVHTAGLADSRLNSMSRDRAASSTRPRSGKTELVGDPHQLDQGLRSHLSGDLAAVNLQRIRAQIKIACNLLVHPGRRRQVPESAAPKQPGAVTGLAFGSPMAPAFHLSAT
jgi:hypothetical protein